MGTATSGRISSGAAASAVSNAAGGVGFTAIGGTGIAILEVTRAGRYRTYSSDAGSHRIGGRTLGTASITIGRIRLEIDFATISRVPVAIGEARVAGAYSAHTQSALWGRMSDNALVTADATVVRIAVRVGLATVGNIAVTIAKRAQAIGNAANSSLADGGSIGLILANSAASIAVVDADVQIHFATIGHVSITAGKADVTGNAARSRATSGYSVGAVARGAAGAAIGGIG